MSELGEIAGEMSEHLMEVARESSRPSWTNRVAIGTMLMGLLSALGALLAGMGANEALLTRTQEAIDVSRIQGERLELAVLEAEQTILESLGTELDSDHRRRGQERAQALREQIDRYEEHEARVERALELHEIFALSVTLLAVAISLSGIALVAERKNLWHTGLLMAGLGTAVFAFGLWKLLP